MKVSNVFSLAIALIMLTFVLTILMILERLIGRTHEMEGYYIFLAIGLSIGLILGGVIVDEYRNWIARRRER